MKKFLNIISGLSLITMAGTSVISCKNETKKYQKYFLPKQPKTREEIGQALDKLLLEESILNYELGEAWSNSERRNWLDFLYESEDFQNIQIKECFIRAYSSYKMFQLNIESVESKTEKNVWTTPRYNKSTFDDWYVLQQNKPDSGITNETKDYLKAIKVWTYTDALKEN